MVDGDRNYNVKDWIINYELRRDFFSGKFGVGRGQERWSLRSRGKSVRFDNELVSFPLCTHRYIKSCGRHFLLLFCDFIKSRKVFL